jgi:hypothetical protein
MFQGLEIMKAVIFHDEFALTVRANSILRRIGQRPDVLVEWSVKDWPVMALSRAASAEAALLDALDAHLIMIPVRHALSQPLYFRDWLRRWAGLRRVADAALAVLGNTGFRRELCPDLASFAQEHGLTFITSIAPAQNGTAKRRVRSLLRREQAFPLALGRCSREMTPHAFRNFGIND